MDIVDLVLPDVGAWRAWLDAHEGDADGVWLVLAKKGVTEPTTLTYDTALDEALCSGWIDGQRRGRDDTTYRQRFTPRRKASLWSQRNLGLVATLIADGRMRERGQAEIDRAKGDGRWDRAYAGPATATVPEDLQAALDASPPAAALFAELDGTNRYAVLHRITTAPSATSRTNRLTKLVAGLERGETPHPRPDRSERRGTPTQGPATPPA
ncbi:YdeI/OmpD-associated family protein [Curtobacterium sp. VKM Ac-2887]|uniref:YdeI/OmpD-associated family protein n=1 Tax=Curtobacterium sp. VKM Ac-2887 TaxID=2783819 RepID=UPI00188CF4DF|nr:YdeI/OmpD-associated family protein [Curtobacterium sp. VKM Ac-2887]MBF4586370.1 YdeI/OmpD-associated family protein [Curtobacterium sp. VKM Ac-2887]